MKKSIARPKVRLYLLAKRLLMHLEAEEGDKIGFAAQTADV